MDCNMPRLPVHHQLPEFTQTHVHWVGDAIQPSASSNSSSVIPFSSRLPSFPASGSFTLTQFFASGGQSIGVSASTSVLPMNTQDWSPPGWTGWSSVCLYFIYFCSNLYCGLSWWLSGKKILLPRQEMWFDLWVGKMPWRGKWQPTPVFLPGKSHGQRSLAGYSPRSCKRVGHNLRTK